MSQNFLLSLLPAYRSQRVAWETQARDLRRQLDQLGNLVLSQAKTIPTQDSVERAPWNHPFLEADKIRRFREYSEQVWQFADKHGAARPGRKIQCGFSVNMAQNMYKWGGLASKYGHESALILNPMDNCVISQPEWEEYDGEYGNIFDVPGFVRKSGKLTPGIPVLRPSMDAGVLINALAGFNMGDRKPLLDIMAAHQGMRHEPFFAYAGVYPYFAWACDLHKFEVNCIAGLPIAAYLGGKPYCAIPVGADFETDCGRGDDYGKIVSLSFGAARFIFFSNPHSLGHARRLGLDNGVYLPYPMDSRDRYCPGEGAARKDWVKKYGDGIYVLSTSRIDAAVKGNGEGLLKALVAAAGRNPALKFVFLLWGSNADMFQKQIDASPCARQFIILPPVGKQRLIDYYRSSDIVLDHFVYGYYGATALEAAAVGKPVVMKLRAEQYSPLYAADVAPVFNVSRPEEVQDTLLRLAGDAALRLSAGEKMRQWLVRSHGEEKAVPRMMSLLALAADRVPLPDEIAALNPLLDPLSDNEIAYHKSCLRQPPEK